MWNQYNLRITKKKMFFESNQSSKICWRLLKALIFFKHGKDEK